MHEIYICVCVYIIIMLKETQRDECLSDLQRKCLIDVVDASCVHLYNVCVDVCQTRERGFLLFICITCNDLGRPAGFQ